MRDPALPARFGRYTLLERVGGGGMATVYRAALSGEGGFEKELALKMVRPELATEPQFVEMFLDEARLSARLGHANLVHTFDFGQVDGRWFLAMEFVRGPTLAALLRICRARGIPLGAGRSVHVVGEVARGLGYAHRLCDETGRHLGLVHRDVSPQNVLVSREGEVKLADFGIAKAASRSTSTRTGHVRGKCAYMAPEQARGEPLDARADVFALGIVLWESLAARPLFEGDSDGAILLQVIQRTIPPPSRFAPDVPPELDELVLRMLARDRSVRPANGDEVARAVAALKLRIVRSPAEVDLGAFLRSLGSGTAPLAAPVAAPVAGRAPEPGSVELGSSALVEVPSAPQVDPAAETVVRRRPAPVGSAPVGSAPGGSAPVGSAPVGSAPVGSAPVGSAPVGSAPVGSAPVGSAPVGSAPVGSAPVGSAPVGAAPVGSAPVGSAPVGAGSNPAAYGVSWRGRAAVGIALGLSIASLVGWMALRERLQLPGAAEVEDSSVVEAAAAEDASAPPAPAATTRGIASPPGQPIDEDGDPPGLGESGDIALAAGAPMQPRPDGASASVPPPSPPVENAAVALVPRLSRNADTRAKADARGTPDDANAIRRRTGASPPEDSDSPRRLAGEGAGAPAQGVGAPEEPAGGRDVAGAPGAGAGRKAPSPAAPGKLVVTSSFQGILSAAIEGQPARQLERWVPAEFELPAGQQTIRFEPPAPHRPCRVRAEIVPGGKTSLAAEPRGIFRLVGLERHPVRCLD